MAIAHLAILKSSAFPKDKDIWSWFDKYVPRGLDSNNAETGTTQFANLEIPGDTLVKPYRNWISIQSYRLNLAARSGTNSYGMTLIKHHDRSSPKLFEYCATDTKFTAAILEVPHADRKIPSQQDQTVDTVPARHKTIYFLRDIKIGNFMAFGDDTSGTQNTSEEISLTYAGFGVIYDTINDGSVRKHWDW